MKNQLKKGFTLVELIVVIAVIAILAAVLIPTYTSLVKKANVSNDSQLVKNLNDRMTLHEVDGQKPKTAHDAFLLTEEFGFIIEKLTPTSSGNEIVWDMQSNRFALVDADDPTKVVYSDPTKPLSEKAVDLWKVYSSIPEKNSYKYSIYLAGTGLTGTLTANVGVDVGRNTGVTSVVYDNSKNTTAQSVVIRTNSINTKLTINAKNDDVNHIGLVGDVTIEAVAKTSYVEGGNVNGYIMLRSGNIKVAPGGIVFAIIVEPSDGNASSVDVNIQQGATVQTLVTTVSLPDIVNKLPDNLKQSATKPVTDSAELEVIKTGASLFAGGKGTEAAPFLITDAITMQNISKMYEKGYYYYEVVIEKTQNGKIDLKDSKAVNLNGSFNGKAVKFINVNNAIFKYAGSGNSEDAKKVVIENFNVDFVGGAGVVYTIASTYLIFKDINVTGYLLEDWNGAVFARYGTANVDEVGFDYTVEFINNSSTAEIYSSQNTYSSILVGHAYEGTGNIATIKVDNLTNQNINNTTLYFSGKDLTPYGYKYFGISSSNGNNVKVYVGGSTTTTTNSKITGSQVLRVESGKNPTKDIASGKYNIATEQGMNKVRISILWQYTEWTKDYGAKIDNLSGVGGTIGKDIYLDVTGDISQVLDKITSVEIKTGSSKWDYELKDGKLTIYMTTKNAYVDGTISLHIEQFSTGKNIAQYKGSIVLATKTQGGSWLIK